MKIKLNNVCEVLDDNKINFIVKVNLSKCEVYIPDTIASEKIFDSANTTVTHILDYMKASGVSKNILYIDSDYTMDHQILHDHIALNIEGKTVCKINTTKSKVTNSMYTAKLSENNETGAGAHILYTESFIVAYRVNPAMDRVAYYFKTFVPDPTKSYFKDTIKQAVPNILPDHIKESFKKVFTVSNEYDVDTQSQLSIHLYEMCDKILPAANNGMRDTVMSLYLTFHLTRTIDRVPSLMNIIYKHKASSDIADTINMQVILSVCDAIADKIFTDIPKWIDSGVFVCFAITAPIITKIDV